MSIFRKAERSEDGKSDTNGFLSIAQVQNGKVLTAVAVVSIATFVGLGFYLTRDKQKADEIPSNAAYVANNNAETSTNGTPSAEIANKKVQDDIEKSQAASKAGKSSVPEFPVSNEVSVDANGKSQYPTQKEDDLSNKNSPMADVYSTKKSEQQNQQYPSPNNQNGQASGDGQSVEFKSKSDQYKALIALNGYARSVGGGETKAPSATTTDGKVTSTESVVTPPTIAKKRVMQAGQSAMVEISTKTNTDRPFAVFGKVISGKLNGDTLIGSAVKNEDDSVTITFNKISTTGEDGKSFAISAIALDPVTGDAGLTGDVNHKIMQRFVLPMTAVAVGTYGQLIAQTNQTAVTTGLVSVTQSSRVDSNRVAQAAIGSTATSASTQLNKNAAAAPATTLPANLLIEVKFIEDVML